MIVAQIHRITQGQHFFTVRTAINRDVICVNLFFACKIDDKEFPLLDIEEGSEKDSSIQNQVR